MNKTPTVDPEFEGAFGAKVRDILNSGLDLEPAPRAALRAGRERALAHMQSAPAAQAALAGTAGWIDLHQAGRRWLSILLSLGLAAACILLWQQREAGLHPQESAYDPVSLLDAEVLKSDIPIDALLDADFRNYLRKSSQSE
jgi:hypothetical protein